MTSGIIRLVIARACSQTRTRIGGFAEAERGVVALEFAIVALPFFMLITGILVVGFMMFCVSSLDFATQKAARQIMVGTTQSSNLTADQFRTTVLCPLLPSTLFDCTKVVVNLTTVPVSSEPTAYYNFVKPDKSGLIIPPLDNTKTSYCPGSGGGYEVLQVLYPMPIYLSQFTASPHVVNNQFILMSNATFKNESFQGSSAAAGC